MKVIYTGWPELKLAPDLALDITPGSRTYGWLFAKHPDRHWVTLANVLQEFPAHQKADKNEATAASVRKPEGSVPSEPSGAQTAASPESAPLQNEAGQVIPPGDASALSVTPTRPAPASPEGMPDYPGHDGGCPASWGPGNCQCGAWTSYADLLRARLAAAMEEKNETFTFLMKAAQEAQDIATAKLKENTALRAEQEQAYGVLDAFGVPRERAKSLGNGIGVLVARMDKEVDALRAENERMRETAERNKIRLQSLIVKFLLPLYLKDRTGMAKLCDEELDTSGALFGWLRDAALSGENKR